MYVECRQKNPIRDNWTQDMPEDVTTPWQFLQPLKHISARKWQWCTDG